MRWLAAVLLGASLLPSAEAANTDWYKNEHGQVRLISPLNVIPSTDTITIGLHFKTIPGWHVYWKDPGDAGIPPTVKWAGSSGFKDPEFLWPQPYRFHLPGDLIANGYEGEVVYPIRLKVTGTAPIHIQAQVDYLTCAEECVPYRTRFTLDIPRGDAKVDADAHQLVAKFLAQVPADDSKVSIPDFPVPSRDRHHGSLLWMLLLAWIGGLILNVMPCVLPVLSIKLVGLVEQSQLSRKEIALHSLLAVAGVLVSFWALAGAAVFAQKAGQSVGWGIQFQEPLFVGFLGVVVLLFALNLWGLFEIPLPRWAGSAAEVQSQARGLTASFVSGLFATLLATPCSAPFLGTAIGFALSQTPGLIFLIFTFVGLGLGTPYLLVAVQPRILSLFPRPGAWMVHLKSFFGFLLAATIIWLLYVLAQQVDSVGVATYQLALLGLAVLGWFYGLLQRGPLKGKTIWMTLSVLAALSILIASFGVLKNSRRVMESGAGSLTHDGNWIPFQEDAIPGYLKEGKTVFVDVTAEWCFTCKANEKAVLNTQTVQDAFKAKNVVAMKADWTNRNDGISRFLARFGKYGIPLYVVYKPGQEPKALPEVITTRMVLDAIN